MTITNEERKLLDILHNATPEGKNYMLITLIAAACLEGEAECKLPKCSRAEYKRHIRRLRYVQHAIPDPHARELAAKSIELIRTVCPIQ